MSRLGSSFPLPVASIYTAGLWFSSFCSWKYPPLGISHYCSLALISSLANIHFGLHSKEKGPCRAKCPLLPQILEVLSIKAASWSPEQLCSRFPFTDISMDSFSYFGSAVTPIKHWAAPPSFPLLCIFIKPLSLLWLLAWLFLFLCFKLLWGRTYYFLYLFLICQSF